MSIPFAPFPSILWILVPAREGVVGAVLYLFYEDMKEVRPPGTTSLRVARGEAGTLQGLAKAL